MQHRGSGKCLYFSDYYGDEDSEPTTNDSPKVIEVERLQEYLSQTLPNIVRQELKRAIDAALAPIEENLTSRLETIVRDCQENATRTFLQSFQPSLDQCSMVQPFMTETQYTSGIQSVNESFPGSAPDALAAYAVPPESAPQSWLGPSQSCYRLTTVPSDSAYYSNLSQSYQSLPSSSSSMPFNGAIDLDSMAGFENGGTTGDIPGQASLEQEPLERYRGKGKGKAPAGFQR